MSYAGDQWVDDTQHLGDEPEQDDWSPPLEVVMVGPANHSPEFCNPVTIAIAQNGTVPVPTQLLQRNDRRHKARINIDAFPQIAGSNPTPNQPAVPASTVPVENTNLYPVTVTISGGTITSVNVNGAQVGTGDGTYLVTSGSTIAVTYSVAPTWVWADANPVPQISAVTAVIINSKPDSLTGPNPQGGTIVSVPRQIQWENQQPLYACALGGGPVNATVQDEIYALTDNEEQ